MKGEGGRRTWKEGETKTKRREIFGSTSSASHSSHWLLHRNLCLLLVLVRGSSRTCGWTRCVLTFALAPGILRPRRDGISGARNASLASLIRGFRAIRFSSKTSLRRVKETNQRLSLLFYSRIFHHFHHAFFGIYSILTIRELYSRTPSSKLYRRHKKPFLPEFPFPGRNS